ncbi:MAG: T9SS type A sorting domain-containing protein [Bacteroidetes bacterium]|nr:T9SS type A sorting domain-containing protein [Bacteroidota bacterium]
MKRLIIVLEIVVQSFLHAQDISYIYTPEFGDFDSVGSSNYGLDNLYNPGLGKIFTTTKNYEQDLILLNNSFNAIEISTMDINGENLGRHNFIYDLDGNVLSYLREKWTENDWRGSYLITVDYNYDGKITLYQHESISIGCCGGSYKLTYSYDSTGSILSSSYQIKTDNVWEYMLKKIYTYNNYGQRVEEFIEQFNIDLHRWVNSSIHIYVYDDSGYMVLDSSSYWSLSENKWNNSGLVNYSYDLEGNVSSYFIEWWNGSQYINTYRYSYTYGINGEVSTLVNEIWEDSQWIKQIKNEYTYNSDNQLEERTRSSWIESGWTLSSHTIIEYNSFGITSIRDEYWNGISWALTHSVVLVYDENGNLISRIYERMECNHYGDHCWWQSSRTSFDYDDDDKMRAIVFADSIDGFEWERTAGSIYIGDSIDRHAIFGYTFSFQYSLATNIDGELDPKLNQFSLEQNYPNPFNPNTMINYTLYKNSHVKLSIYNILGQEVAVLVNGIKHSGNHQIVFHANNLPSGTYYYRLISDKITSAKKMILMR